MNSAILKENQGPRKDFKMLKYALKRLLVEVQAKKSIRRMPWHQEPTKDVTSCEKLRLGANIHRPADIRMGKPGKAIPYHRTVNP